MMRQDVMCFTGVTLSHAVGFSFMKVFILLLWIRCSMKTINHSPTFLQQEPKQSHERWSCGCFLSSLCSNMNACCHDAADFSPHRDQQSRLGGKPVRDRFTVTAHICRHHFKANVGVRCSRPKKKTENLGCLTQEWWISAVMTQTWGRSTPTAS